MSRENKIYEFKSELLKDFAKYPDSKISARQFVGIRIRDLKKKLKKEPSVKKRFVIKRIIKIYEQVR